MTAFTQVMTDSTALEDSLVLAYDTAFIIAAGQDNVMDQLVQYRQDIGAVSIKLTKYARLGLATTALTATDDIASTVMSDIGIVLTPAEYGAVVTQTNLVDLQSGGKAAMGAMAVVGINAGSTTDKLACLALDASSNVVVINGKTTANLATTDIASRSFMNSMYNKLARNNVQKIGGMYVAVMHDDVINDLRNDTATGAWIDVLKYARPEEVLQNEVGMIAGFRIVRDNNATFTQGTGGDLVDSYNSYFLGADALGKAESQGLSVRMTGPYDKLGRFINVGWYWVGQYKIIDQDAVYVGVTASSVGNNAA